MLADANTRANVLFTISEGPQVIVDHVIIIGNKRTSTGDDRARADAAAGRAARLRGAHREPAAAQRARTVPPRQHHRADARVRIAARRPGAGRGSAADDDLLRRGTRGGTTILRPTGPSGQARGAFRVGAARVVRDDAQQPVGQEPLDRSVHPRQPAVARRARHRSSVSAPAGVRPRRAAATAFNEYRVLAHLSRAEGVQHAGRRALTGFSTRRSDRASTSGRAKSAAKPDCT